MKVLILLLSIFTCITGNGQSIVGKWITFDDETKEKKAIVEIYEQNGLFHGKIIESFVSDPGVICEKCTGLDKDKPIVGLVILKNLVKEGKEYIGGSIMDPENGKTYSCYLSLVGDQKLKVRGYIGVALLGRTQYWVRKD